MKSNSINNLVNALKKLPGVGERTAERFVFHWLKAGKGEVNELKNSLDEVLLKIKSCRTCWDFSETDPCVICNSKIRDRSIVCVVLEPQDIPIFEKTGEYNGLYHCLRGHIDTTIEDSVSKTKIPELITRVKNNKEIKELILALNQNLEGETTAMYITAKIKNINPEIKVSRLARGLPMGSDLQYADEMTLTSALKNRR